MKLTLVIFLFLVTQARADFCSVDGYLNQEDPIAVDAEVNYFMRSSPGTAELGFATKSENIILNANLRTKEPVEGFIDPVLTPDGKLLSTPREAFIDPKTRKTITEDKTKPFWKYMNGTVYFCNRKEKCKEDKNKKFEDLLKLTDPIMTMVMSIYNRKGEILFEDNLINYTYQSFGQLKKETTKNTYRLLFETNDGLAFRDFEFDSMENKFKPVGEIKPITCDGKIKKFVLPALSKSGTEFAAYDPKTGETKIIEIGESGTGCESKETFPALMGKPDFSPDSKLLAFHVDHASAARIQIFDKPKPDNNFQAYVYDRKKQIPYPLIISEEDNSYFPVFLDNQRLAMISSRKKDKTDDRDFFVRLGTLKPLQQSGCKDCYKPGSEISFVAALAGAVKIHVCSKDQSSLNFKSSLMSFSQFNAEKCRAAIDSCDRVCLQKIKQRIGSEQRAAAENRPESEKQKDPIKTSVWNLEKLALIKNQDLHSVCDSLAVGSKNGDNPNNEVTR